MRNLYLSGGQTFQINCAAGSTIVGSVNFIAGTNLQQGKAGTFTFSHAGTGANATLYTVPAGPGITITGWSFYNSTAGNANFSILVSGTATGNTITLLGTLNKWTQDGTFTNTGQLVSSGTAGTNATAITTSVTSITIGLGSKAFTHASITVLGWGVGARMRVAVTASPTVNWMEGIVTAATATVCTIQVDKFSGSGTFAAWTLSMTGDSSVMTDVRTAVAMVSNGTLTIDSALNGNFTDNAIYLTGFTGGTTENNLIDITNATAEKYYNIQISRDATAGTKTINFVGVGRTYNRSWLTGTLPIGVSEKWNLVVRATNATNFDVIAQRVA